MPHIFLLGYHPFHGFSFWKIVWWLISALNDGNSAMMYLWKDAFSLTVLSIEDDLKHFRITLANISRCPYFKKYVAEKFCRMGVSNMWCATFFSMTYSRMIFVTNIFLKFGNFSPHHVYPQKKGRMYFNISAVFTSKSKAEKLK